MDSWASSRTSKSMPSVEYGGTPGSPESMQSSYSSDSQASKSAESLNEDVDEEYPLEDNVLSPIDLEGKIQAERISKILDDTIYNIKLAITMPMFIHQRTLEAIVPAYHLEDIRMIFREYEDKTAATVFPNMRTALADLEAGNYSMRRRLHPELALLIYVLNGYPAIKPIVNNTVDQMKRELMLDESKPAAPAIKFLLLMEFVGGMMKKHLWCSAEENYTKKLRIQQLQKSNEKLVHKIQEYELALRNEMENADSILGEKEKIIKKLEEKILMFDIMSDLKLHKMRLDTDRAMVTMSREHAATSVFLKEEEDQMRLVYENTLKDDLDLEKSQRLRRFKCETQLMSWVDKYDIDMTDRQGQLDDLTQAYDEEEKIVEELEARLAEQDKEYYVLMAEREEEYNKEMAEKMAAFQIERAARIIQHAWRTVLANKAEKKKLRKLVKKKEEAEEAAFMRAQRKKERERAKAALAAKAAKKNRKKK